MSCRIRLSFELSLPFARDLLLIEKKWFPHPGGRPVNGVERTIVSPISLLHSFMFSCINEEVKWEGKERICTVRVHTKRN